MKQLIIFGVCLVVASLFIGATGTEKNLNAASLEGVWELQHQFIYENNEVQDTLFNLEGYRQVKIYSKGKVMWTRFNPTDTNEWFGYGTYQIVNDTLEERLEYASNAMMKIVDTVQVFRFELDMGTDTYSQISFDRNGKRDTSENYTRIE